MYFHTDERPMIEFLMNVASLALQNEQRLRIDVDESGRLRVKRGEGMWTHPFEGTDDPYREPARAVEHCHHDACYQRRICAYF